LFSLICPLASRNDDDGEKSEGETEGRKTVDRHEMTRLDLAEIARGQSYFTAAKTTEQFPWRVLAKEREREREREGDRKRITRARTRERIPHARECGTESLAVGGCAESTNPRTLLP